MSGAKPIPVERVVYRSRSFRSWVAWWFLRFFAYPVIWLWARFPHRTWPFHLFDVAAGKIVPPLPGTTARPVALPNCEAEFQTPPGARDDRVILYLHGGAFLIGGLGSHRRLAAEIGLRAHASVLTVAYRKLPDHPPSVSLLDCIDGYRWLLGQGYRPGQIVIAGDSAGGFLTAMTAITLRDGVGEDREHLGMPAGLIFENPLIDPTPSRRREGVYRIADPQFPHSVFSTFDEVVREKEPAGDVLAPLDGDVAGLPPVLIQVGSHEILRVDSEDFAAALGKAGVPCRLEIYRGQPHVFQAFADALPEARIAIRSRGQVADAAFTRAATAQAA